MMQPKFFGKMIVRSIRRNKVSSLLMIFTISLVTVLFCVISSTVNIYADALLQSNEYQYGTWIYAYEDASIPKQSHMEDSRYAYIQQVEQGTFQDSSFTVKGIEDPSNILPLHLQKGRFARNDHEIVISESLSQDSHFQIGQSIFLKEGDPYKIVGIVKDSILTIDDDIYTLYTQFDRERTDKANIYQAFAIERNQVSEYVNQNASQKKNQDILIAYQDYENTIHYRSGKEMKWFVLVVAGLIFICMGIVIHNMYRLSFQHRNSYFHLLKQNNFTAKQIQKLAFLEMFLLSIIGIGFGVFLSYVLFHISFLFLNPIFQSFMKADVKLHIIIAWKLFGLALLMMLVLQIFIFYATYRSINGNPAKHPVNVKQLHSNRFIYALSKRYMCSYKKAQHAVILSISVSFLFVSLSNYFASAYESSTNKSSEYNLVVMSNVEESGEKAIELSHHLIDISHETNYQLSIRSSLQADIDSNDLTPAFKHACDSQHFVLQFYLLDDDTFHQYVKTEQNSSDLIRYLSDEKLPAYREDGSVINEVIPFKKKQVTLITPDSTTLTIPITSIHRKHQERVRSIIPIYTTNRGIQFLQKYFQDEPISYGIQLSFKSKHPYQLEKTFQKWRVTENVDLSVSNSEASQKQTRMIVHVIQLFLSFLSIFLLIMMTVNIVITMMISMLLRKAEFAQLRSIGMNSRQFYKMIGIEYLTMSLKGIVIGNIAGCGFSYLLYLLYMHIYGAFQYPWAFMIGFSVIVLCLALLLAYDTKRLMSKGSLYQTLQRITR